MNHGFFACPDCNGIGCPSCNGMGIMKSKETSWSSQDLVDLPGEMIELTEAEENAMPGYPEIDGKEFIQSVIKFSDEKDLPF